MAFSEATSGGGWRDDGGWLSDKPLDQWHGVRVEDGRVTGLGLGSSGEVPASIGGLIRLDLSANSLTGGPPQSPGDPAEIAVLPVAVNRLTALNRDVQDTAG